MNLIKKAPLMAFVLGLGLMTITALSSFINSSKAPTIDNPITYIFVNTNLSEPRSVNPADYKYRPLAGCEANEAATCKANWLESSAPLANANPQGTFQSIEQDGDLIQ